VYVYGGPPNPPYSAERVIENTGIYRNGTRFDVKRYPEFFARDSRGRTRSETNITQPQNNRVTIVDDTAGYMYVLDGAQPQVARRYKLPACEKVVRQKWDFPSILRGLTGLKTGDGREISIEDLGTRVIEGVSAHGLKTTQPIGPAATGKHGPAVITHESWLCEELGVYVLGIKTDPTGVETDRLINITRAEPDPSLFEVPPDYRIEDEPTGEQVMSKKQR
jgi:hypothetical protein